MAGWGGFSEEDLHRLKKDHIEPLGRGQPEEKPENLRKAKIDPGAKRTKPREKIRTKATTLKKNFNGKQSANGTNGKSGEIIENFAEFEVENSTPECERNMVVAKVEHSVTQEKVDSGKVDVSGESAPDIILEPERIQAIELSALQKMQQKQKEMEDQNKLKKAAIQETIRTRFKKTQAEAQILKVVQQELAHLDSLLSADVAILRDTIEDATRDYHYAMKRYEQAEAEFVAAKIELHRKCERKELLTEHLYAIIQQNEERKAKKLEELMAKLNLSDSEIPLHEESTNLAGHEMAPQNTISNDSVSEVKMLKVDGKKVYEMDEKAQLAGEVEKRIVKQVDTEVNVEEIKNKITEEEDMGKNGMK